MISESIALARALSRRGVKRPGKQAALLGLSESTWARYRSGRSPQCSRLSEWLERLAKEGIRLHATEVEGTGWVVTEVSDDDSDDEGGG